jgi:hypothetical protein
MENALMTLLPSIIAIVGVWVKLNMEVAKLKSRVLVLERDSTEIKEMIRECVDGINDLKLLLAKKGI